MAYGAYLATAGGVEFVTPETTSIALERKLTASGSGQYVTVTATVNTDDIVLPFCVTRGGPAFFEYVINGNNITISARQTVGMYANITLEVYLFTTKAQNPPEWGMAVWDSSGKCILTNETRILTDLTQIGVPGGSANNGVNINYTMPGKYAIVPQAAGYRIAVSSSGTLQTPIGICCYYDGTNSTISARLGEIPPGSWTPSGVDFHTTTTAINAVNYD